MAKIRVKQRKEYFRSVSLGRRKSCPSCHRELDRGESIWSWGEYVHGKWYNITKLCKHCWKERWRDALLVAYANYEIHLHGYRGEELPEWLTLEEG